MKYDEFEQWAKESAYQSPWKQSAKFTPSAPSCHQSHPVLDLGNGMKVYGGSCHTPVVTDADIYVGLDHSMQSSIKSYPWEDGESFLFPINDMQAPKNAEEFKKLIDWLLVQLAAQKKVHIGCVGGHGRTGLVLSALVQRATGNLDAVSYVRKHYCKKVVESGPQMEFLHKHFGITKEATSKNEVFLPATGFVEKQKGALLTMSVTTTTRHPLQYAKLFQVDPSLIDKASALGLSIVNKTSGQLVVTHPVVAFPLGMPIAVKATAITLAKQGQLGKASLSVIKFQIEQALLSAIDVVSKKGPFSYVVQKPSVDTPAAPGSGYASGSKVTAKTFDEKALLKIIPEDVKAVEANIPPAIDLKDATGLLQVVHGTSTGTVYRVVAQFDGLNIAIRRTPTKLSIRAEGSKLSAYTSKLATFGFHQKANYASVHLDVTSPDLLRKTLGAVIGSMGVDDLKAMCDPIKVDVA